MTPLTPCVLDHDLVIFFAPNKCSRKENILTVWKGAELPSSMKNGTRSHLVMIGISVMRPSATCCPSISASTTRWWQPNLQWTEGNLTP